jgi:hypothetical protein
MANARGRAVIGQVVDLTVTFYGFDGAPTNTDNFPTVQIAGTP